MAQQYYRRPCNRRRRGKSRIVITVVILIFSVVVLTAVNGGFTGTGDGISPLKLISVVFSMRNAEPVAAIDMPIDIIAPNVCVINAGTGGALYQKNANEQIAPASTTKLLTALTVLDFLSPDYVITVGTEIEAMAENSSRAWLSCGDTLTVRQLLIALLLPSGNDAAYTLAVNAGGSIERFTRAMNRKAIEIGATSSNFTTPDGYDAEGQYTTAYDLAMIAKACLKNSSLSEIMGSYSSYETWKDGREVTYYNTNELINPASIHYYSSAIGMKTGNSSQAGACLVSAALINGETYICVVMGSTLEGRFQDSITIYNELKAQM